MRSIVTFVALALIALPIGAGIKNNGDGTVTDSPTGLQWTQRGNGEDINFEDSVAYCEALTLAGFDDWRLPTLAEAKTLFRPDREPRNTYQYRGEANPLRIDDAFSLTAPGIWTSSASYRGVPTTYLYSSGRDFSWRGRFSNYQRVLCVRDE